MPAGAWCIIWSVWDDGFRELVRLCEDCEDVVYGCHSRRPLDYQGDRWLVRDMCVECDQYPTCERAAYLRESVPGEWFLGALERKATE